MKKLVIGLLIGIVVSSFILTITEVIDLRKALAQTVRPIAVYLTNSSGSIVGGGVTGTGFYAVERTNISTSSVNLAFGVTSKKLKLVVSSANTDDICIDYAGTTAVCPAANTAGDDRLKPGTSLFLDDFSVSSISVIAASGTQSIQVTAWQ